MSLLTGIAIQPSPWDNISLNDSDVHVWVCSLDNPSAFSPTAWSTLSTEERNRAKKFKFNLHRNRYITGHVFLRECLARYTERRPHILQFTYGPFGKPTLTEDLDHARIHFNLAHSENLALLAITRAAAIGADIENIRPLPDMDSLVERFFSARESALFQEMPANRRRIAFFNLWTRKEAFLKATGEGIGQRLNKIEVSFEPGKPAKVHRIDDDVQEAEKWQLHDLPIVEGFAAAIALKSSIPGTIRTFQHVSQATGQQSQKIPNNFSSKKLQ
jgi:4'-phosphopantetheinyl transferase